jgi:hypothetical protein
MDAETVPTLAAPAPAPPASLRAAGALSVALGTGFGLGAVLALRHLGETGELPMTPWGFRALSGPFEQLGEEAFTTLGWALTGICALDVVAGVWLWRGRRRGALLSLATTPVALGLGAGFALPFLLAGIPIREALVVAGRRGLR